MLKFIFFVWIFLYFLPPFIFIGLNYSFQLFQIFVLNLTFLLGLVSAMIVTKNIKKSCDYQKFYIIDPKYFYLLFIVYMITKFSLIIDVFSNLVNGSYIEYSYNRALSRYEGEELKSEDFFQRIGTLAFLMSGSIAASVVESKNKILLMLLFMIFIESSGLARLGVLIVFITYIIEITIRNNHKIQTTKIYKLFGQALILFSALSIIFLYSAYFRVYFKDDVVNILLYKLGIYTISMYEALMQWMSANDFGNGLGTNTLAGIYKIFGYKTEQGFYELVDTSFGPTNIYTNLRGLLSDFGFLGSSVILFISGFMISYYSKARMTLPSYLIVRIMLFLMVFNLFSPFIHFNTFASFMLSGVLIVSIGRKFSQ